MVRHAPAPVPCGGRADDDRVLVGQGTGEDNFIVRLTEEAGSARQNGDNRSQDSGFVTGKAFAMVLAILTRVAGPLLGVLPMPLQSLLRCQNKGATGRIFNGIL